MAAGESALSGRRICKKCLLRDILEEKPLYALIQEYLASLPQEQKADPALYEERLAVCSRCDHLQNGTCRQCGCYVETRAAKKRIACPDVPARWGRAD